MLFRSTFAFNFDCRKTPPGLAREPGSTHYPNRKEDSARTPTWGQTPTTAELQPTDLHSQATIMATILLHFLRRIPHSSTTP